MAIRQATWRSPAVRKHAVRWRARSNPARSMWPTRIRPKPRHWAWTRRGMTLMRPAMWNGRATRPRSGCFPACGPMRRTRRCPDGPHRNTTASARTPARRMARIHGVWAAWCWPRRTPKRRRPPRPTSTGLTEQAKRPLRKRWARTRGPTPSRTCPNTTRARKFSIRWPKRPWRTTRRRSPEAKSLRLTAPRARPTSRANPTRRMKQAKAVRMRNPGRTRWPTPTRRGIPATACIKCGRTTATAANVRKRYMRRCMRTANPPARRWRWATATTGNTRSPT
jgi:Cna protein B-type domain